jgi:hypothetical protein
MMKVIVVFKCSLARERPTWPPSIQMGVTAGIFNFTKRDALSSVYKISMVYTSHITNLIIPTIASPSKYYFLTGFSLAKSS